MIWHQPIDVTRSQRALLVFDVAPRQGSNVLDESLGLEIWKRRRIHLTALRIHFARHHTLATKSMERVMKATDPGEEIDESKLRVSPRHSVEHTVGKGRN
jgi:hypothetical protein